jgi:dolichyl-phosphate-mannose--protein O-mannosyl transferase
MCLYLQNIFFFDYNPPLDKMMIAGAGYLSGFDGMLSCDEIGNLRVSKILCGGVHTFLLIVDLAIILLVDC